jgi:hypothetical protein
MRLFFSHFDASKTLISILLFSHLLMHLLAQPLVVFFFSFPGSIQQPTDSRPGLSGLFRYLLLTQALPVVELNNHPSAFGDAPEKPLQFGTFLRAPSYTVAGSTWERHVCSGDLAALFGQRATAILTAIT